MIIVGSTIEQITHPKVNIVTVVMMFPTYKSYKIFIDALCSGTMCSMDC